MAARPQLILVPEWTLRFGLHQPCPACWLLGSVGPRGSIFGWLMSEKARVDGVAVLEERVRASA